MLVAYAVGEHTLIRRSEDRGLHWGRPSRVPVPVNDRVQVALAGPVLSFAWTDQASGDIDVRRSVDAGRTFDPVQDIARGSICDEGCESDISLSARGRVAWLTWYGYDASDGATHLWAARSIDRGGSFAAPVDLGTDAYLAPEALAVDGVSLFTEFPKGRRLALVRSDGGPARVTDWGSFLSHSAGGVFAAAGGRDYAAESRLVTGRAAVVLRTSIDAARSWTDPEIVWRSSKQPSVVQPLSGRHYVLLIAWWQDGQGVGPVSFARRAR